MPDLITRRYLPPGIDSAPTTVQEALTAARTLLAEENRWRTSEWFKNEHPEHDPDDPFCNSWQVCAEGAVALVVVGTFNGKQLYELHEVVTENGDWTFGPPDEDGYETEVYIPEPWCVNTELICSYADPVEKQLYLEAVEALRQQASLICYGDSGEEYEDAFLFNDNVCTTAQDVLDWFDATLETVRADDAASG